MINKKILRSLSYGVYVVSAMDEKRPIGCVVNSAFQLTHDTIAVSLNHENYTNSIIKKTKEFALSILSEKTDSRIISVFGFCSGKNNNKFEKLNYKMINNLPILKNSVGYITLKTIQEIEVDTHTLFIAKIMGGEPFNDEIPMTYKYYHDIIKGRAPKTAPTYISPDEIKEKSGNKSIKYRCKICGYIYDGDITKESDDYICPICKKPKSFFEKV